MSSGVNVVRPSFDAACVPIAPFVSKTRFTRSGSLRKRDCKRVRPFPIGNGPAFAIGETCIDTPSFVLAHVDAVGREREPRGAGSGEA